MEHEHGRPVSGACACDLADLSGPHMGLMIRVSSKIDCRLALFTGGAEHMKSNSSIVDCAMLREPLTDQHLLRSFYAPYREDVSFPPFSMSLMAHTNNYVPVHFVGAT